MDWLLFAFALEFGAIRGPDIPVDVAAYVQTEATATILGHLEIGGTMRSYQTPFDGYEWSPLRMDYSVSAVARFGEFSFGVEHLCYHPVGSASVYSWQDGGWERAFVRIATPRTRS